VIRLLVWPVAVSIRVALWLVCWPLGLLASLSAGRRRSHRRTRRHVSTQALAIYRANPAVPAPPAGRSPAQGPRYTANEAAQRARFGR
jgi:hypothetical protein